MDYNKKPLKTVHVWPDCKSNSKTLTQMLTKMLTTDGRTSSIHQLELFCNPAKSTVGQNQSNYTKSHMSNSCHTLPSASP